MPGGLLNLVSYGNQNIMINGNPTKTMFKTTYAKHTNFGLQKFRIDYEGSKTLNITTNSHFDFKVPRYADLLMDTYLVVQLPDIWSPMKKVGDKYEPYEFKWIKNLGTQMIHRVRFTIGGQVIQEYTGQYLTNMVERDFDDAKKKLYYNMTGNIAELNDPSNRDISLYKGNYPNAKSEDMPATPEPSIKGRKLYIPLNIWFTLSSKMAFPLTALQYNELHIEIDLRPVKELFVIKDANSVYRQPDFNNTEQQFHIFIQPPINDDLTYSNKKTDWNNDIHLISTYAFLTDEEAKVFSENSHDYLIKEVYHHDIHNITGPQRSKIETNGLVSNFMWYFQRSDVNERNEWSNYTNWQFDLIPNDIILNGTMKDTNDKDIYTTGVYDAENEKTILKTLGIVFDGKYRENPLDEGVFNYIEKYTRTSGNAPDGLYFYNFGIKTNPVDIQPTGGVNLSKFKNIEFEWSVNTPPQSNKLQISEIYNENDVVIGTVKDLYNLYKYSYSLTIFEERYNILTFMSGSANLKYAR